MINNFEQKFIVLSCKDDSIDEATGVIVDWRIKRLKKFVSNVSNR